MSLQWQSLEEGAGKRCFQCRLSHGVRTARAVLSHAFGYRFFIHPVLQGKCLDAIRHLMVNVRAHVKNPKQALLAIPLFEQENTAHTARPCGASAALAAAVSYPSV